MRPRFEDPIDTVKDMMDNNITLFRVDYGYQSLKEVLLSLDIPEYTFIAENMVSITWDEREYYMEHYIHGSGTHAVMTSSLDYDELKIGEWWKSSEYVPGVSNYVNWLSNRNWKMNEVSKIY